jgi:hypothetical protein
MPYRFPRIKKRAEKRRQRPIFEPFFLVDPSRGYVRREDQAEKAPE